MNTYKNKPHVFDTLFVTLLFFVFLLCALSIIVIGSSVYQNSAAQMNELFATKTATAYLTQKIRQNDVDGNIDKATFADGDALLIRQTIGENLYHTFIYVYQGQLMELFILDGVDASPASGKAIMDLESMGIQRKTPNLLHITLTDQQGNADSISIAERSRAHE
ncbi:MAG: DUF4860 domain-containing protein [Lachnospiraceae bacterium]|nr:DUF4860 domain-containing protein [Lachnospiraceae bacterium]